MHPYKSLACFFLAKIYIYFEWFISIDTHTHTPKTRTILWWRKISILILCNFSKFPIVHHDRKFHYLAHNWNKVRMRYVNFSIWLVQPVHLLFFHSRLIIKINYIRFCVGIFVSLLRVYNKMLSVRQTNVHRFSNNA